MNNIIPWECFKQLKHVHLRDTAIRLFAFRVGAIDQVGVCHLGVRYRDKYTSANFTRRKAMDLHYLASRLKETGTSDPLFLQYGPG